jgi:hypothetical protein
MIFFFLTSAHEDEAVQAPPSSGAHDKIQQTTVLKLQYMDWCRQI